MELKDYNLYAIFLKAVELKNYSRVAEVVGLSSHKIVSDKMKLLEEKLGVKLFVRSFRSMEPTSDAVALYEKVKTHLEGIDAVESSLGEFEPDSKATIKLIAPSPFVTHFLFDFFQRFNKTYPNVNFHFYNRSDVINYEMFLQRKIDLAIDLDYNPKPLTENAVKLFSFELMLIASKNYLASNNFSTKIDKNMLAKLRIIGHSEHLALLGGLKPGSFIATATLEPVFSYVEQGGYVGICHTMLYDRLNKNTDVVVPLDVFDLDMPRFDIICNFNKETVSKAAKVFVEELVKYCAEIA